MNIKSFFAKPFAQYIYNKQLKEQANALINQQLILNQLVKSASNTLFGKEHQFKEVTDYESFKKRVPIRDYEGLKSYFQPYQWCKGCHLNLYSYHG